MSVNEPLQIVVVERADGAGASPVPQAVLRGELDLAVCDRAWETLEPVLDPQHGLILDVTDVGFIDSRGLNVLVRVLNSLDGGKLVIRGASQRILRLLEVSGLQPRVTIE